MKNLRGVKEEEQQQHLYTFKPESVIENETRTILYDFKMQPNHLIPARKPDLLLNAKIDE